MRDGPPGGALEQATASGRPAPRGGRLKQPYPARAERADAMGAKQIDRLADKSAPAEEQATRKRDPEEFRGVRVDRPKGEGK